MTLFIAYVLLYHFGSEGYWYYIAFAVWTAHLAWHASNN